MIDLHDQLCKCIFSAELLLSLGIPPDQNCLEMSSIRPADLDLAIAVARLVS